PGAPQGGPRRVDRVRWGATMIDAQSHGNNETTSDQAADTAFDPFDRVAEDFLERCRRGESPSISDYEQRYPAHARRIRELLPSVAMMEQLKRQLRPARDVATDSAESMPDRLGEFRLIRELG